MKTRLTVAVATTIVALAGIPQLQAQTTAVTTPVGYHTIDIPVGFTVFGQNFVGKVLAAGMIDTEGVDLIRDAEADFDAALTLIDHSFVTITSGLNEGRNASVTGVDAMDATELELIAGAELDKNGSNVGETYELRQVPTVAELLPPGDPGDLPGVILGGNTPQEADVVWIYVGGAEIFRKLFWYTGFFPPTPTWRRTDNLGAGDQGGTPIYPTTGMLFERKGTGGLNLVIDGHVKTKKVVIAVEGPDEFNFIDRGFPVGMTLGNSGLAAMVVPGTTPQTSDTIWFPIGGGSFNKYFYYNGFFPPTPSWRRTDNLGLGSQDSVPVTSGFIFERKGPAADLTLTPDPLIYDPLNN